MEALLATIGMAVLMVLVLAIVARSWPRSSGLGGYRARSPRSGDAAPPIPENDDARWNWTPDATTPDAPGEDPSRDH